MKILCQDPTVLVFLLWGAHLVSPSCVFRGGEFREAMTTHHSPDEFGQPSVDSTAFGKFCSSLLSHLAPHSSPIL